MIHVSNPGARTLTATAVQEFGEKLDRDAEAVRARDAAELRLVLSVPCAEHAAGVGERCEDARDDAPAACGPRVTRAIAAALDTQHGIVVHS